MADHNVTAPNTKGRTFPVEVLPVDEARRLIDAFSRRSPSGIRNRALVAVMYRAGLRLGEALALAPRDIDFTRGAVNVRRGKGAKQRTVGIDRTALDIIERWLAVRDRLAIPRRGPLFCLIETGKLGGSLDASYVRAALRRAARKAGIERRVHPHALRHSCFSELVDEGKTLTFIQHQAGHSSAATTGTYLRKIAPRELIDGMAQRDAW